VKVVVKVVVMTVVVMAKFALSTSGTLTVAAAFDEMVHKVIVTTVAEPVISMPPPFP